MPKAVLPDLLQKYRQEILDDWLRQQLAAATMRADLISQDQLRAQSTEFLQRLEAAAKSGDTADIQSSHWAPVLELLGDLSRARGRMGFSPSETAGFVFSLKSPIVSRLRLEIGGDAAALFESVTSVSDLLDKLGLYTTEVHQRAREEVINRQQLEMLELSTPVVKLWDGIVALPLIGTLDSARTNVVMESLLQQIVDTGSDIAIIDITGVPTVDTLVAQHLLKTVSAARLMGADCIISGIRPQIAQTMVHLGIDLTTVATKATMAEALRTAMTRAGYRVVRD
ncbi:MAG TPA: STAS domain-containing protein [Chthoniobacteraceae bacterium]|jgi:rsbT co-antagonist protein RsbR|nr:STAS domain-containing protein [Chthoniobacteraceae bacterium]